MLGNIFNLKKFIGTDFVGKIHLKLLYYKMYFNFCYYRNEL